MNWNEWIETNELELLERMKSEMNDFTWMNELKGMNEWIAKSAPNPLSFLLVFCEIELWLKSRAHFGRALQSRTHFADNFEKWFRPVNFLRFLCEIELSLQSRAHFVDLIFKKWSETVSFLWFSCEIELSLQSGTHFADHFLDRAALPRKQRPSSGGHGRPLYLKKRRVLRPRVFSSVNSRIPDRSHSPYLMYGWHDDVVARMFEMMMWLPWWWDSYS